MFGGKKFVCKKKYTDINICNGLSLWMWKERRYF